MATRNTTITVLLIALTTLISSTALAAGSAARMSGFDLVDKADASDNDQVSIVVFLEDDQVQEQIHRAAMMPDVTRAARIQTVSERLQSFKPAAYDRIAAYLESNSTEPITRLWIVPAISATLTRAQINELADMDGVKLVIPDVELEGIDPVEERSIPMTSAAAASIPLSVLNVPHLWNLGLHGEGRIVCSFDTGVEESHPALAGNWRGNNASLRSSWMSTVAPDSLPYDKKGHGSHTMGCMVGVDGADTIGVAPGAEWITAGVVDQGKTLSATITDILLAFQWAMNPDGNFNTTDDVPDVILNSWGVPTTLFDACDDTFWRAIDNVEAAGIVTIFAAGNEGPNPGTIRNPASRATTAINSFAVGAVNNDKVVANFSSRGPATCGQDAIKPEVVAPGVSIRSVDKNGGYKFMSGTSMAAPYVAGLVALCRQYNPDATVEEIKWALIRSAEDLGPVGEDNAYGNGLVDASRLLQYLPSGQQPDFSIVSVSVVDENGAAPNETFDLRITLNNSNGNVQQVTGHLSTSTVSGVTILNETSTFFFGEGGTTALNTSAFSVHFDNTMYNGQEVDFTLTLDDNDGSEFGSLDLALTCGFAPAGDVVLHNDGLIEFSVTDFGQYGLAQGSIYAANGAGFRYDGSENLLYEAGIIVGRSALQLSSAIRGSESKYQPSDFAPVKSISQAWTGSDQGTHRVARLADSDSDIPLPITVSQETIDFGTSLDDGVIMVRYQIINNSLAPLTDLHFGFLADFDLSDGTDVAYFDDSLGLVYQQASSGPMVGLKTLAGVESVSILDNGDTKLGMSRQDQYGLISGGSRLLEGVSSDVMFMVSTAALTIQPGDSTEVAFALVAGDSFDELTARAQRANELFATPTSVEDTQAALPTDFELAQNYPNPFNPTTTISFTVPAAGDVTLTVYNALGQTVRQLAAGTLPAGTHTVEWDATNNSGDAVASGVYFYRLQSGDFSDSRKMVLLR